MSFGNAFVQVGDVPSTSYDTVIVPPQGEQRCTGVFSEGSSYAQYNAFQLPFL